jgi:hypothetical protein
MRRSGVTSRGTIILALGITLLTTWTASGWALDSPEARATVEGLGSVHTIVGTTLPDGYESVAPLYAALQTDVEFRLHRAAIRVDPSFTDRLLVVVDIFGEDDHNACLATVDVEMRQFVLPTRTRQGTDALPGNMHRVVWARCADLDRQVRDNTRDLVDQFITAYLEQNPRP